MTVCALNATILTTTLYKSNCEKSITDICNKRAAIAYQTSSLIGEEEDSPAMRLLNNMDQQLELQQKVLETQQKAVAAELESLQKLLDNNIKKDFTINLNA